MSDTTTAPIRHRLYLNARGEIIDNGTDPQLVCARPWSDKCPVCSGADAK